MNERACCLLFITSGLPHFFFILSILSIPLKFLSMTKRESERGKSVAESDGIDRLSIRERPQSMPIMHQNWGKLVFMHWRIEEAALRPLIPEQLTIDTFDGAAWIAITPFTMWG